MAPLPLSHHTLKHIKNDFNITPGIINQRPILAALVLHIITIWAQIELEFFQLTASWLEAKQEFVAAMLLELSSEGQRAAMRAAAKQALANQQAALDVFHVLDARATGCRTRRNDFVHGVWAVHSSQLPDALLLFEPAYFAQQQNSAHAHNRRVTALFDAGKPDEAKSLVRRPLDRSKLWRWRESDLKHELIRFEKMNWRIRTFHLLSYLSEPVRSHTLRQLDADLRSEQPPRTPRTRRPQRSR